MIDCIFQKGAKTCGHVCVAMLARKSEEEIIDLIGHSKGTKTKELVSILNHLKIKNSGKLIRISKNNQLPEVAIIKAIPKSREKAAGNWHWVLKYNFSFLDPYCREHLHHLKFVSFIEIINFHKKVKP